MYPFEDILEESNEGFAIVSIDGQIKWCNLSFSSIFGYNKEELIGLNISVFCASQTSIASEIMDDLVKGAVENIRFEKKLLRKDKSLVWCKVCTNLIKCKNNVPQFFFVHVDDVTKCKQHAEMLKSTVHDIVEFINKH